MTYLWDGDTVPIPIKRIFNLKRYLYMYYKFTMKERLDGTEMVYEEESDDIEGLMEKFDNHTMLEKELDKILGWNITEFTRQRLWFFEAFDPKNPDERRTTIRLMAVL